ncbi:MAG: helix-turn-helix domain-containing protein [Pseudomonadota bacterium]
MLMQVNSEKIRRWREERCWSQEHLAEVAGVSLRTIQRLENGGSASKDSVMSLAAAFGVDVTAVTVDVNGEAKKAAARQSEKKNLQFKLSFWIHLATYMFVITLLVAINIVSDAQEFWVLWPAIGWGIGVLAHGFSVFVVHKVTRTEQQIDAL